VIFSLICGLFTVNCLLIFGPLTVNCVMICGVHTAICAVILPTVIFRDSLLEVLSHKSVVRDSLIDVLCHKSYVLDLKRGVWDSLSDVLGLNSDVLDDRKVPIAISLDESNVTTFPHIDYYFSIIFNIGNSCAKWAPISILDFCPKCFIFNFARKVCELVYSALKTVLCLWLFCFLSLSCLKCHLGHSLTRVIPFFQRFTIGTYPLNLWVTKDISHGKGRWSKVGSD